MFSVVKLGEAKERNLLMLFMLFFFGLATLRAVTVGNDTWAYSNAFNSIRLGRSLAENKYEVGYFWLNKLIGFFTKEFNIFLGIVDVLVYYAYYRLIKGYSSNYGLSLLLFLCFGYWGYTVNILRQELAIAMFIYAFLLADKGQKCQGFVASIFAPFFQRTSIAYYLFYFLPKKINKKFYVLSSTVAIVAVLVVDKILFWMAKYFPKYRGYLLDTSRFKLGRIEPTVVVKCVFLLFVWAMALYFCNLNKENLEKIVCKMEIEFQINMIFMASMIMFTAVRFNLLDRCAMFFNIFVIVLIPNIISLIEQDDIRHLVQTGFIVIAVGYFVVVNVFRPDWNHIYPYRLFFQIPS